MKKGPSGERGRRWAWRAGEEGWLCQRGLSGELGGLWGASSCHRPQVLSPFQDWGSLLPLVFVLAERHERMNEIPLLVAEVSRYLPQSFAHWQASRWVVVKCSAAIAFKGVAV